MLNHLSCFCHHVFYYRVGCYWIWLHIRRYCSLHGVDIAWPLQRVYVWLFGLTPALMAIWSPDYFHRAAFKWSHLQDCSFVWPWCVCGGEKNEIYVQHANVTFNWIVSCNFKHFCVCVFCSEAIQTLQTEVARLRERLESLRSNKKPPSTVRAAPSVPQNTSTPRVRLFFFFRVWSYTIELTKDLLFYVSLYFIWSF